MLNNKPGTTSSVDVSLTFGAPGDIPIVGDWDGDGSKTPGVVRGNTWYLRNDNSTGPADISFTYGNVGDTPVVGDWDGNGTDTPGVVRGGNNWYLRNENSTGGGDVGFVYGIPGDRPIVGDWDGNGTTTPGMVRGNTWYLRNENSTGGGDFSFSYGLPGDKLVVGDWDGNGTETVGVVRGNAWYLQNENAGGNGDLVFYFGLATDIPVAGPWASPTVVQPEFSDAGGWANDIYGTTIRYGDIDGDGNTDVCGRGQAGIYCATFNGSYGFGPMRLWSGFFSDAGGWAPAYYGGTIQLADVNGDGRADVCGRTQVGVYCAISNGTTFGSAGPWESTLSDANGWASGSRPIAFGDVNGDGLVDVCGRGYGGVVCGLSNGSSFSAPSAWDGMFTDPLGWAPIAYSASFQIADVNGDGLADACARGVAGYSCELSNGHGFPYQSMTLLVDAFSDAGEWNQPQYASTIRVVPRVGAHDVRICGRGASGVYCAEKNQASPLTFSAIALQDGYFNDASGWGTRASNYESIGFGTWKNQLDFTCGRESDGIACIAHRFPPATCSGPPPEFATWWVPGVDHIEFQQLAPGEYPNNFPSCSSGCGPTAWAMFFAATDAKWRALAAAGKAPAWTSQEGWFQTPDRASSFGWSIGNYPQITIDVSHWLGTSCGQPFSNESYTEPSWMVHAYDYLTQGAQAQYSPHGPLGSFTSENFNYSYDAHGTGDSIAPDYANDYHTLDYARSWIINYGYPVVYGYNIGANVITNAHYGLATGYREKATASTCEYVRATPQWVVTKSDSTAWQFYLNGGGADPTDWKSPAAFYVGTIKIDKK